MADPAATQSMGLGIMEKLMASPPPPPSGGFMDGVQQGMAGIPQQVMGGVPGALGMGGPPPQPQDGMVASVAPTPQPAGPQPMSYEEFVRQMMGGG